MFDFKLPSLGADMEQGKLLAWQVKPGDQVKRGQVVAVVDTSKAAVDVEIWQDGVIEQLLVQPGQTVPVGTVLATLSETEQAAQVAGTEVSLPKLAVTSTQAVAAPGRVAVTPAARRRAKELNIDAAALQGSGAQGAVTLADVEAAAGRHTPLLADEAVSLVTADRPTEMRKAIAAAMSRSKREIPHYYLAETIPMAAALAWLHACNENSPITERILPVVLQIKAVALALQRVPQLNGQYRDGSFQPASAVNAGVAISLRSGGLVAPALFDVGAKSLPQLMRELADLVQRARAGSLRSSEMSDASITITNLGEQGVASVFGVIYPPQVALVGFGRIAPGAWVEAGQLCASPLVTATLAADHRVSDGHQGAIFLAELRDLLQQPQRLADSPAASKNKEATS